MRQLFPGTSPYEPIIGFSRAVRTGNHIAISGTGPVGADSADAATQTRQILNIVEPILHAAGASFHDVTRTRIYLTRFEDWEAVGRVHGEFFKDIRPAATMLVVSQLLNPTWRVEIEFEAILSSPDQSDPSKTSAARFDSEQPETSSQPDILPELLPEPEQL